MKNTTDDLATTLREAREWDRRFLAGERLLVESRRLTPPPPPPDVAALIEGIEREEAAVATLDETREASAPVARPTPGSAPGPSAERPTSTPRAPTDSDYARLAAGLTGRRHTPIPETGTYTRLAEALAGSRGMSASADDYTRLRRALQS